MNKSIQKRKNKLYIPISLVLAICVIIYLVLIGIAFICNSCPNICEGCLMCDIFDAANVIEPIATILLSIATITISVYTYRTQKKLTHQSVKPFLSLDLVNTDKRISVNLKNDGIGVAIIKTITFTHGDLEKDSLIDLVELIDKKEKTLLLQKRSIWKRYEENLKDKAIGPQAKKYILEIDLENNHSTEKDKILLNNIRKILSETQIKVEYQDIYGNNQTPSLDDNLHYFLHSKI